METLWDGLSDTDRDHTHGHNEGNGEQFESREEHGDLDGQFDPIDVDQN